MALTANDIRDRAASVAGLLRPGQSLQSQDATRIEQAYAEVYADLEVDQLASFLSTSVPDEVAPHVVMMVAHNFAEEYGISDARYQRILTHCGRDNDLVKREIRKVINPWYASQDGVSDY